MCEGIWVLDHRGAPPLLAHRQQFPAVAKRGTFLQLDLNPNLTNVGSAFLTRKVSIPEQPTRPLVVPGF